MWMQSHKGLIMKVVSGIPAVERKPFKNNHLNAASSARGGLNPILGFYFPLFSMVFPREFPSGWKTAESSGSKSLVFFGQRAYIFYVRFSLSSPFPRP